MTGRPDVVVTGGATVLLSDVEGVLSSALPGLGLRARGRAPSVQFADVHRLLPEFPEDGIASFDWTVEPAGSGLTAIRLSGMNLASGESRARRLGHAPSRGRCMPVAKHGAGNALARIYAEQARTPGAQPKAKIIMDPRWMREKRPGEWKRADEAMDLVRKT